MQIVQGHLSETTTQKNETYDWGTLFYNISSTFHIFFVWEFYKKSRNIRFSFQIHNHYENHINYYINSNVNYTYNK